MRFGLMASFMRTAIAPAHLRSSAVTGSPLVFVPMTMRPRRVAHVLQVGGHGQDRHDLAGDRDVEAGLARHAVELAAEADDDVAQRAVVEVDDAPPRDRVRIDVEVVALVDVVVDVGGEQVVRHA